MFAKKRAFFWRTFNLKKRPFLSVNVMLLVSFLPCCDPVHVHRRSASTESAVELTFSCSMGNPLASVSVELQILQFVCIVLYVLKTLTMWTDQVRRRYGRVTLHGISSVSAAPVTKPDSLMTMSLKGELHTHAHKQYTTQ